MGQLLYNKPKKICFDFRQWSLLLGILMFTFSTLVTVGSMLGLRHSRNTWGLLLSDLTKQEENQIASPINRKERLQRESNIQLLLISQIIVKNTILLLDAGVFTGFVNQIGCAVMVYGIAVHSARSILPWIVISGITYMLLVVIICLAYFDSVPGVYVSFHELLISLAISSIFIVIWYTMLVYYCYLSGPNFSTKAVTVAPKIIKAYGGYVHTVDDTPLEKKVVV